ncbi:MAG: hypothetical protein UD963_02500, partial [Christensenellales bacterium]|nr:hypothetical protein [Christensenellales bacterium]
LTTIRELSWMVKVRRLFAKTDLKAPTFERMKFLWKRRTLMFSAWQYCVFGRAHALAVLMRLSIADGRG